MAAECSLLAQYHEIAQFSAEDRRTMVLLSCYQSTRRRMGDWGFRAFHHYRREQILGHRMFRTAAAVRVWMEEKGWVVSYKYCDWQAYVRYVFEEFRQVSGWQQVPHLGQLKNNKLAANFLRCSSIRDPASPPIVPDRSLEDLRAIYRRVVREDLHHFTPLLQETDHA